MKATQPLSMKDYKVSVKGGDTTFIFSDTINRVYVHIWDKSIPDTSLIDGKWILPAMNNPTLLLVEVTYKNKVRDGFLILRNNAGRLIDSMFYKNGLLEGRRYSYNATTYDHFNYLNGVFDGEQKTFYTNNKLAHIFYYSNGKINGEAKWFNRKGSLSSLENYRDGKKDGEFMEWDDEGRLAKYSYFINDIPVGVQFDFYEGKLRHEVYFKDSLAYKEVQEYYTLPEKVNIKKAKGETYCNANQVVQKIKREVVVLDNIIYTKEYYETGQQESEVLEKYIGEKDCKKIYHKVGRHKYWDESGKLVKELIYEDDKLLERKNY